MLRLRSLSFIAALGAVFMTTTVVRASLVPGRPPLTGATPNTYTMMGEAQFDCGTYRNSANTLKWQGAMDQRVQAEVKSGKLAVNTVPLNYVYNDVWIIENDGTLALSGTNAFDTNAQTHQYSPGGGNVMNIASITFTYDAVLGTTITPGDDGAVLVTLPFSFPFAGSSWTQLYVSGNGAVSFGAGINPNGFYDNADFFSTTPKITPFYLDLNSDGASGGSGTIAVKATGTTKYTVTWSAVREYGTAKLNTAQLVLYPSGIFTITYNGIASTTQTNGLPIIIGFHPGGNPTLQEISFSGGLPFASAPGTAVYEQYFSYTNPLVNEVALFKKFYQQFPDEFFQLNFFTNFTQTMGGFANELNIKNDVTGIGLGLFDGSSQYGSASVLESRCNMNRLSAWLQTDPTNRWFSKGNNFLTIMGQEAGHRWGAFLNFRDALNMTSNLILGRSDAHWSYYTDVDHSALEGGNWVNTGGNNYTCPTMIDYFSEIDEYTFGLRTPEEVKDFFLVSSVANNDVNARSVGTPLINATCSGQFVPVTVEDVIAEEGARTPTEPNEQHDLRQGFIFLLQAGTVPSQADLDKIAGFRSAWEDYFEKSCDGRLTCNTSLTTNYPVAAICGHVHDKLTTAIIPEFTATSLQRGFNQHVPDGGRYTFRYQKGAASGATEPVTIVFNSPGYYPDTLTTNLTYGTTTCGVDVFLTPIYTGTGDTPTATSLEPNHPNPFNPATTIAYTLASSGHTRLTVFDTAGRRVRTLVDGTESGGAHSVLFDGRDDNGRGLASGVYFYRLEAPGATKTRKMVLLK